MASFNVTGHVWNDRNKNIYVNPGEEGIEGVVVTLYKQDYPTQTAPLTAVSDSNGNYNIDCVPEGRYIALFSNLPNIYRFITDDLSVNPIQSSPFSEAGWTTEFNVNSNNTIIPWAPICLIDNKGEKGDIGPTGPVGPIGPIGPTGATGPVGPIGPVGPTGAPGPIGPIGPTGATGPVGPIGPVGPAGPIGPVGPAGPKGDSGNQGATGPQGPQGVAGPQGNTGAIGPIGPTGPVGPIGPTGATGPVGPVGPIGPKGDTGAQGLIGPRGPQGIQGEQGPIGPQGPAGTSYTIDNLQTSNKCNYISHKNEAICFKNNVVLNGTNIYHIECSDFITLKPGVYLVSYSASVKSNNCCNSNIQLALTVDGNIHEGSESSIISNNCDLENISKTVIIDVSNICCAHQNNHRLQLINNSNNCFHVYYPTITVVKIG